MMYSANSQMQRHDLFMSHMRVFCKCKDFAYIFYSCHTIYIYIYIYIYLYKYIYIYTYIYASLLEGITTHN